MDKPLKSRLDEALNAAAEAFRARIGVMSRHTLHTILRPFGADVAEAAIVTLEGACMRAKFAERGQTNGRDLLQFDPVCEMKLRHHRALRDSALAKKAVAASLERHALEHATRRRFGAAVAYTLRCGRPA